MIIGLLGSINSGKGTVANRLVNNYNFRQDSFAASLKDACSMIFDWPRHMLEGDTKESREWREQVDNWWANKLSISGFSPRLALQLVGTDILRDCFNQDIWFLALENKIRKNTNKDSVISDTRFPNEIEFIKNQGGILIEINRGNKPEWYETAVIANTGDSRSIDIMKAHYSEIHYSEWAWAGTQVDYSLNNDTLENLYFQIDEIIADIMQFS